MISFLVCLPKGPCLAIVSHRSIGSRCSSPHSGFRPDPLDHEHSSAGIYPPCTEFRNAHKPWLHGKGWRVRGHGGFRTRGKHPF